MRAGVVAAFMAVGCQGTSGGIQPDAREFDFDATIAPCSEPSAWASAPLRPIAPYQGLPGAVAVDETYAYWTEFLVCPDGYCTAGPIVLRAPLAGGEREVLFESETEKPGLLGVTRDYLFVIIGNELWRSRKDGTAAAAVSSTIGFVTDADALYTWQDNTLIRLAADSLEETPIGTAPEEGFLQLAADAAWWLGSASVDVWRMPLASGDAERVIDLGTSVGDSLAIDALGRAFLAIYDQGSQSPPFLARIAGDGAEPERIADLFDALHTVRVDDAYVYWLDARGLFRMPLDGGCIEMHAFDADSLVLVPATEGIVVASPGSLALVER